MAKVSAEERRRRRISTKTMYLAKIAKYNNKNINKNNVFGKNCQIQLVGTGLNANFDCRFPSNHWSDSLATWLVC